MARSLLSQVTQIAGSAVYSDSVADAHSSATAVGQSSIEGDLNILRTLMKDLLGGTEFYATATRSVETLNTDLGTAEGDIDDLETWQGVIQGSSGAADVGYSNTTSGLTATTVQGAVDEVDGTVDGINDKYFIELTDVAGFTTGTTVVGSSTTAFSTAIKTITGHADGAGSSTVSGVILNGTTPYKVNLRYHSNQNPIDDGAGNEVYGRLTYVSTDYVISFYSNVAGTETAFTFATDTDIDIACVGVSRKYSELSWLRFLDFGFHDVSGFTTTILDTNVTLADQSYANFLSGATTQEGVNDKVDALGTTTGAGSIGYDNSTSGLTATTVGGAIDEVEGRVDTLETDLANLTASEVAATPPAGYTSTNVQGLIDELASTAAAQPVKVVQALTGAYTAGDVITISGGTFEPAVGGYNMDVYYDGQLLRAGTGNDYTEETDGTGIKLLFDQNANDVSNLTFVIRLAKVTSSSSSSSSSL